ncbi:hypothetical protein IQ07DRAFT_592196 [Pyrenochaeta sp. DS3sAY3a]|nr:hypothetical protein IQ07DRAFT_592196 [Pyrenochaeta sp. DS3sAY3a]
MSKPKPFPAIAGGCACNTIRYRLLTSPLFCYACHCGDCQKSTGSAFGLFLNVESYNLSIISPTRPTVCTRERKPGKLNRYVECPRCKSELWDVSAWSPFICDVRVGTLDFPSLMEPDVHSFVESKLDWLILPPGARTTPRGFNSRELWPKSSLKRLEICERRFADVIKRGQAAAQARKQAAASAAAAADDGEGDEASGEGEKTPTAVEFGDREGEDDEAFEKRFRETERALQERLEKLTLKLEEERGEKEELAKMIANGTPI